MEWLSEYQRCTYEDGARGPDKFDCWGLVREVRHKWLGCRLLPSFGHVRNTMPREFTKAYELESATMRECPPEVGAIAAVFRGRICVHVAVIVEIEGALAALEIRAKSGVRWWRISEFERINPQVKYYAD